ncbi:MAG: polymerase sigma factor, sigma-70 family [Verrucomicrobiales bacterium]|nr:polymerase sigma factor, sigma-70 family [Verrucomicrobiales bacterium]
MEDRELLGEYVKSGSQGAFRELVERHLPVVYSTARRMVNDAQLAEEIAQNVFTTLAQKAASIRSSQVLGGWLYNTTRNLAMHALRSEQRRRAREQTAFDMQSFDQNEETPDITQHLEPAMEELEADDRDALVLRFLGNRALREVGTQLGISEEAARKRVNRALERLRGVLERRKISVTGAVLIGALSASTIAVPSGLGATISSTALSSGAGAAGGSVAAAVKGGLQLKAVGALIAGAVVLGGGIYLAQHSKVGPSKLLAATPRQEARDVDGPIIGTLKTADGRAVTNAEVFLSTVTVPVPVYTAPTPSVTAARTGKDGRFAFPRDPDSRAVIAVLEQGYGEATVSDLAAQPMLTLKPWTRIEGTLREGQSRLAHQVVRLSRKRFGSKLEQESYRTVHDTTAETDAEGHYVFPRVAPGDAWIAWKTEEGYETQYRYVDVQPGKSLVVDLGGMGRPVTGLAVLGDDVEGRGKMYGSVWPRTVHQMRRPPNWPELSKEEQRSTLAAWEKTPDAKLYNQEKCPIDFRLEPDGKFTVLDLPAGAYTLVVASWSGAPVSSKILGRGVVEVLIPEMPGGRSDEPLELGVVGVGSVRPLRPDDPAPLFETKTFTGEPWKLVEQKGKFVLLHFWKAGLSDAELEVEGLRAVQSKWGKDKRFVMVGINCDRKMEAAKEFAAEHQWTWTQCFLGEKSTVPGKYRLKRPTIMLIGPEGVLYHTDLGGPGLVGAVEEVLMTKPE